jgi:hypothetical protein
MQLFPVSDLEAPEARAIIRGLHMLAGSDGLHPQELVLLQDIATEFGEGAADPITPEELAAALPALEHRLMFMKFALLLAHMDGQISKEERELLAQYSLALELTDTDLLALDFGLIEQMAAVLIESGAERAAELGD